MDSSFFYTRLSASRSFSLIHSHLPRLINLRFTQKKTKRNTRTHMDSSHLPVGAASSSRKSELLGPRPTPLKVRKDSYKIKKPPVAPQPGAALPPPHQQIRQPIIIYTISPKVIHTTPGDFMSVVQRLTGAAASSSASDNAEEVIFSPAARLATFERSTPKAAKYYPPPPPMTTLESQQNVTDEAVIEFDGDVSTALFPGILSPVPSSLPGISPNLFTQLSTEPNQMNYLFNEIMISPAMQGSSRSLMGMNSSFMTSPSNFLSSGIVPSPAASYYWDLFNQL